jgi:hypothetical protein
VPADGVVELGEKVYADATTGLQISKRTLDEINSVKELGELLAKTNSRGKKQRIQKKMDRLEGKIVEKPADSGIAKEKAAKETKDKVKKLLKKRDEKLEGKKKELADRKNPHQLLNAEDQ